MEQIYYTQCPVGYGLGASNGFQVKRLSPGYSLSGDFGHFSFRPFLPGTRALAPFVLRYRRGIKGVAELAFLSPRNQEYETERGLWGRPGGHFAHGLRLNPNEMAVIHQWPAGLYGQPYWCRTDPQPSLGRLPDAFEVSPSLMRVEASFEAAASLAAGWDQDRLANLLTVLAASAQEGRTVVILDRADRLADSVALLTLAFPEAWRGELTFSTYHDRPEELHGFRLQGTVPDPRLNRSALLANGFIADLTTGLVEPASRPAKWATILAGWLIHRAPDDREAWDATNRRASAAHCPEPPGSVWSDDWLGPLYDWPALLKTPNAPANWQVIHAIAEWSSTARLGMDWAKARPARWFRERAESGELARRALLTHLRLAEAWEGEAARWGETVASWLDVCPPEARQGFFDEVLEACPKGDRAVFAQALVASASPEVAVQSVRWIRAQARGNPALLLPMEIRGAVDRLAQKGEKAPIRDLMARARQSSGTMKGVLDAIAIEAANRPKQGPLLHKLVAEQIDDDPDKVVLDWAIRQQQPEDWIGDHLRLISSQPNALGAWKALRGRIEPVNRPAFTKAALAVAGEPEVRDEVFRWCVESLLLRIPEDVRPRDRLWPGFYVDKTPSGLDLMRRLFGREYRELGLKRWLDEARTRGDLTDQQLGRIEGAVRYARALKSGDVRALLRVDLPVVPASERGAMLGQILSHVGKTSDGALGTALDTVRAAWPGGFEPGAEGLRGLAEPLAECLALDRIFLDVWIGRLVEIIERLGIARSTLRGFEPNGLAAHVIAASVRKPAEGFSPWRLREFLLRNDATWRALAEDIRQDQEGRTPGGALTVFEDWDKQLSKGMHTARFFEVWLNASEGPALAATVASRANDLKTLPELSWWNYAATSVARDDLRDAFARLAPIAPLPEDSLAAVRAWIRRSSCGAGTSGPGKGKPDLLPIEGEVKAESNEVSSLSPLGLARWQCLEALTCFYRTGIEGEAGWQIVTGWTTSLPLDRLDNDDQLLFLSWLIPRLEEPDSLKVGRLASWLVRSGMTEPDRLTGWAEQLERWVPVSAERKLGRVTLVGDLRAEWRTVLRERGG